MHLRQLLHFLLKTHLFSSMINLPFMASLKESIRPSCKEKCLIILWVLISRHIVIIANRLMNTLYEIHLHQRRVIKVKRLSKVQWIFPQSSSRKVFLVSICIHHLLAGILSLAEVLTFRISGPFDLFSNNDSLLNHSLT